jgi:beta-glucanase (GH16 family)
MANLARRLLIFAMASQGPACGESTPASPGMPPTGSEPSPDAMIDVGSQPESSTPDASPDLGAPMADAPLDSPGPGADTTATNDAPLDGVVPVSDARVSDSDARAGWQLVWSDEFNGPGGTKPDPTKWGYDLGGGGWGVQQLQVYTSDAANAAADGNGNLAIVALKSPSGTFTSARLKTEGKFEKMYGRFEVRAMLPSGVGMWPAFWTLGNDFATVNWPNCGEIDIMENRAIEPTINHGSLHGPGYSGMMPLTAIYTLPNGASFTTAFHTFAIEWELNVVRFYVDDNLYETRTPMDLTTQKWVFEHPHFLLLNLAVGGRFPTNPTDTTPFPQTLLVDYVRVYSRAP